MRTLRILGPFLLFCLGQGARETMFRMTGPGARFTKPGSVLRSLNFNVLWCASLCSKEGACLAFNAGGSPVKCELLNTTPIVAGTSNMESDSTWNLYTYVKPQKCPVGSLPIDYDIPPDGDWPDTLEGYTCTPNSWLQTQLEQGLKDCRLVLYALHNAGLSDSPTYAGISNPFHEALKYCYVNNCIGMACSGPYDVCYLKLMTIEDSGSVLIPSGSYNYWKATCQ